MEKIDKYILPINLTIPLNDVSCYFNFNCFQVINKYTNINIYYNILNHLSLNHMKNIINFINIKWNIIKTKTNNTHDFTLNKYIKNCNDFNETIKLFINGNVIMCIFVINSIIKYISII